MDALNELQHQFQQYLLQGNDEFPQHVVSTEKVPADIRLAIYKNAYSARLQDALASNFPMLYDYVGTEIFAEIAAGYINQSPSIYRSIRWYGDHLTTFLASHSHYQQYPYLAELAQFEWLQALAFDAADGTSLQLTDVAGIAPDAWEQMTFKANPSVQRGDFAWNVEEIWQALIEDKQPADAKELPEKAAILIWRRDLINHFRNLSVADARAVDAMLAGASFGEICAGLCEWCPENEVGNYAASLLKGWIESGILSAVTLDNPLYTK